MFDLNEQITKWRTSLAESEKCSKADIDELENHLREEIDNLTPAGLSQQEAFAIAKGRLGDTASLEDEFAKVNGGYMFRNRLFWMAAGAFAYLVAGCLAGASGNAGAFIGSQAGLGAYSAAAVGIAAGALAYGVILLLACLTCRPDSRLFRFSRFTGNRRDKIVLFASLVVMVLALGGVTVLFSALMTRTMGKDDIGRLALVSSCVRLTLRILLPTVLLAVLIKLPLPRYRVARR
ncbi:MAG: permease prefix domain 1-containing protein [Planctomycetota bacterium]|jgi:hypothetical protein